MRRERRCNELFHCSFFSIISGSMMCFHDYLNVYQDRIMLRSWQGPTSHFELLNRPVRIKSVITIYFSAASYIQICWTVRFREIYINFFKYPTIVFSVSV